MCDSITSVWSWKLESYNGKIKMLKMGTKTGKVLTVHRFFHFRSDTDRLYLSRNKHGRGKISYQD